MTGIFISELRGANTLLNSDNGSTWVNGTAIPDTGQFAHYACNSTIIVCSVDNMARDGVTMFYSYNGLTWSTGTIAFVPGVWGIVWNGTKFIALGYHNGINTYIATSTDGITWTVNSSTIADSVDYRAISQAGTFTILMDGTNSVILTSTNGTSWTTRSISPYTAATDCAYGAGIYTMSLPSGTNVLSSSDTITWTPRALTSSATWSDVEYGNNFCIIGTDFTSVFCSTSTNGTAWTVRTLPVPSSGFWQRLVWNGSVFCSIGSSVAQAITSTDGTTWATHNVTSFGNDGLLIAGIVYPIPITAFWKTFVQTSEYDF